MAKDPYCEVYKVVFARAEKHGQGVLRRRLSAIDIGSTMKATPVMVVSLAVVILPDCHELT
jgi:hypothetical protein